MTYDLNGKEAHTVVHGIEDSEFDIYVEKESDGSVEIRLATPGFVVSIPSMEVKSLRDIANFFYKSYTDLKG